MNTSVEEVASDRAEVERLEKMFVPVADVLEGVDRDFAWLGERLREIACEVTAKLPPESRGAVAEVLELKIKNEELRWKIIRGELVEKIDRLRKQAVDAPVGGGG